MILRHPDVPATKDFGNLTDAQLDVLISQGWLLPQEEPQATEPESPEED